MRETTRWGEEPQETVWGHLIGIRLIPNLGKREMIYIAIAFLSSIISSHVP